MKPNLTTGACLRRILGGPILAIALMTPMDAATMAVEVSFTEIGGGNFRYDLTISNTGSENIPLVSINDAPANEMLIMDTLTAPVGFFRNYDPIGFIDFGENTDTFMAGETYMGFGFESAANPGSAFTDFSGFTDSGVSVRFTTTLVRDQAAKVPDGGTSIGLFGISLLGLVGVRRKLQSAKLNH